MHWIFTSGPGLMTSLRSSIKKMNGEFTSRLAEGLGPRCSLPSYRVLLVTCTVLLMLNNALSILVQHPSRDFCRVGFRVQHSLPYRRTDSTVV